MRDMIQNHMIQLLALVAMEPPIVFDAEPSATRRSRCSRRSGPSANPTSTSARCAPSTGAAKSRARPFLDTGPTRR